MAQQETDKCVRCLRLHPKTRSVNWWFCLDLISLVEEHGKKRSAAGPATCLTPVSLPIKSRQVDKPGRQTLNAEPSAKSPRSHIAQQRLFAGGHKTWPSPNWIPARNADRYSRHLFKYLDVLAAHDHCHPFQIPAFPAWFTTLASCGQPLSRSVALKPSDCKSFMKIARFQMPCSLAMAWMRFSYGAASSMW